MNGYGIVRHNLRSVLQFGQSKKLMADVAPVSHSPADHCPQAERLCLYAFNEDDLRRRVRL